MVAAGAMPPVAEKTSDVMTHVLSFECVVRSFFVLWSCDVTERKDHYVLGPFISTLPQAL